jgi:Cu+-exporting ATPase
MEQVVLQVSGLKCGGCVTAVREALEAVAGVAEVEVSLEAGEAVVSGSPLSRQALVAAVTTAGYGAE